jgi:dCMP deaminase
MFMEIAHIVSKRATCYRLNVGAVVVSNNRIVSIGYNGSPPGYPHCAGASCPGRNACKETIHAEENALRYCPRSVEPQDIYVTDSPCCDCAKLIIAADVRQVFFARPYRITTGLDKLLEANVRVYQVTPAGYVIDWRTREIV